MKYKLFLIILSCLIIFSCASCASENSIQDSIDTNLVETFEPTAELHEETDDSSYTIYCYFKDVDYMQCLKNKKIEIIPALEITYEQYIDAIDDNNNVICLDGKRFEIDTSTIENYYYARLIDEFNWYSFSEPDEKYHPVSVVEGYTEKEPIVVEISDDLMIRYGVLGYNDINEPYGYESIGRNVVFTADEYFLHFDEYSFGSYYRATVENGKLIILDVLYKA